LSLPRFISFPSKLLTRLQIHGVSQLRWGSRAFLRRCCEIFLCFGPRNPDDATDARAKQPITSITSADGKKHADPKSFDKCHVKLYVPADNVLDWFISSFGQKETQEQSNNELINVFRIHII
jgi:hypothetical protein